MAIYLPVFWDHIPTLVTYHFSCAGQAGSWIYKSLDEWKKENPGVEQTLVPNVSGVGSLLNQRFELRLRKFGPLPVNRWRWEKEVVDTKTQEVLARSIDFSAGNGNIGGADTPRKFWLQQGFCDDGRRSAEKFNPYVDAIYQLGAKG